MTTDQRNPAISLSKPWILHLVFWIIVITFVAVYLFSIQVNRVHSTMGFADFQEGRTEADLRIRLSQPSLLMVKGVYQYKMDGWIQRVDIPETNWSQIRVFIIDREKQVYWIADHGGTETKGIITSTDIQVPNTAVKISIPPSVIPPGVYKLGAEICSTENKCYYSVKDNKYLYVTPNSMQLIKPKNLAKIQSIGTRQRALNFINETFFPEKK